MTGRLSDMLREAGLAWTPRDPHSTNYVEMSPELGNAVMATLAFACAEDEGLKLVTEFPELFGRLIHQPKDKIFEACLAKGGEPTQTGGADIAEFVVYQRCDPAKLTPERIQALNREWEALAAFKDALESAAQSLPTVMLDENRRRDRLNDIINDIFRKWKRDRANLSSYARELFGEGVLSQPEKLLEKVAESALGPTVVGALVGDLTETKVMGAAVGFAIGVFFHAAKSVSKVNKTQRQSPLRYLTLLEKSGVGFVVSR
jgi:hypothetical protein